MTVHTEHGLTLEGVLGKDLRFPLDDVEISLLLREMEALNPDELRIVNDYSLDLWNDGDFCRRHEIDYSTGDLTVDKPYSVEDLMKASAIRLYLVRES